MTKRTDMERFQAKYDVAESGCWLWNAALDGSGYGSFGFAGRVLGAHRVAWMLHVGDVPDGFYLHHDCGKRSCVNPAHLRAAPIVPPAQASFDAKHSRGGPEECWLWTAGLFSSGYGQVTHNGVSIGAHRLSWLLHNGPIPDDMFICHKCDVRACVNPAHLFLGTPDDNMQDKVAKGRQSRLIGEANPTSKLTDDDVRAIRRATGVHETIARRFNICRSIVSRIKRGEGWTHVA